MLRCDWLADTADVNNNTTQRVELISTALGRLDVHIAGC